MNDTNPFARFQGAALVHLLVPGTKTTRCGKDATLAHRYPALTRAKLHRPPTLPHLRPLP